MDHCYDGDWLFDLEAAYTFNHAFAQRRDSIPPWWWLVVGAAGFEPTTT